MTNFEKAKEMITLEDFIGDCAGTFMCDAIEKIKNKKCEGISNECEQCWRWLAQEYVEPILDDAEREYLSAVIKPFRDEVKTIQKFECSSEFKEFIFISCGGNHGFVFPPFAKGTMYKGMELNKHYTLEELGL